MSLIANYGKALFFPGLNLHARERYSFVPGQFGEEISADSRVLDVGCGNGMLCYKAWQRGAVALGITIKEGERRSCTLFFNDFKRIPTDSISFALSTIFMFQGDRGGFDALICTDVLEHIRDDAAACRKIRDLLKPDGRVHITVPNAGHPYNAAFPLDREEKGGHVRPGYTEGSLRLLLESAGFQVEEVLGFGGPIRQAFNRRIKETQERFGAAAGFPLFLLSLPFLPLDPKRPRVPFSLYAKCRRPKG